MTDEPEAPESLLPYDRWTEDAMREVALRALEYVVDNGLPGEHHFYLTFRTGHPGVRMPAHLRARYPEEMTIVLQHQYRDLKVDRLARTVSVGLVFGGVPASLVLPFGALTAFWDPHVRVGMRFRSEIDQDLAEPEAEPFKAAVPDENEAEPEPETPAEPAQVVSLDAFRRKRD
ncbi:hypothetical protein IAI18_16045 [Acetobacteraceae bacterium H6797]|nr:hypothetical protein [Acetobacteraceae bacterium H6797]